MHTAISEKRLRMPLDETWNTRKICWQTDRFYLFRWMSKWMNERTHLLRPPSILCYLLFCVLMSALGRPPFKYIKKAKASVCNELKAVNWVFHFKKRAKHILLSPILKSSFFSSLSCPCCFRDYGNKNVFVLYI